MGFLAPKSDPGAQIYMTRSKIWQKDESKIGKSRQWHKPLNSSRGLCHQFSNRDTEHQVRNSNILQVQYSPHSNTLL